MARFSDLAEDLVAEILALLPVDSLMQCKCVQKSWYSLITNPIFIVKQLRNQMHKKNNCVLLNCKLVIDATHKGENVLTYLTYDNQTGTSLGDDCVYAVERIADFSFHKDILLYPFFGHCHGIICLASSYTEVILANPAIREFRELPVSCFHPFQSSDEDEVVCLALGFGFGYDPKSNDYKVVRILIFIANPRDVASVKVEVYTLSTDSWREVTTIIDPFEAGICLLQTKENVYFNGACYWMARGNFHDNNVFIVTFDMSDEVFGKIPVPKSSCKACKQSRKLMVLNESLAFVLYDAYEIQNSFEIWVMDEFSTNGAWKKLFTVELDTGILRPLVFWKNDKLLMEDGDRSLHCYNLGTQEIKRLPFHRHLKYFSAVIYVSSLVSVRGGNKLRDRRS